MEYKEMIKLRALEVELNKQRKLIVDKMDRYLTERKPINNIEYEVLCTIKDFYTNSLEEINKKF